MKLNDKTLNILICSFTFLFLISFPFDLFIKNEFYILLLQLINRIIFIIFILIYSRKYLKKLFFKINLNDLYFFPFILILFCNFYYLLYEHSSFKINYDNLFIVKLFSIIFTSISEELLFRNLILNNLNFKNKFLNILVSSLIFSLYHLVYFLSSFNVIDLFIPIYTFGLGFILGFIYVYSKNMIYIIVYHFLFNFINQFLYSYIIINENLLAFIINGLIVYLLGAIYLLLIYKLKFKKLDANK